MTARLRQAGIVRSWRIAYMGAIKLPSRAAIRLNRYPIQFSSGTKALARFIECGIPKSTGTIVTRDGRLKEAPRLTLTATICIMQVIRGGCRVPSLGAAPQKASTGGLECPRRLRSDAGRPSHGHGEMMRQYWIPAALPSELKSDGDPMTLMLLGE